MPKTIGRSRDDSINIYGKVDQIASFVDQNLTQTADVTFASVTTTSDVTIGGDLIVSGLTTVINTDVLTIKDSIIEINSLESGAGVSFTGLSGLLVNRGSLPGYQIVFRESDDSVCIGQVNDLQVLATRQDNPIQNGVMIFNNVLNRLDAVNTFPISLNFGSNEASNDSSSGSLRVTGGMGITGNIFSDGRIHLKGNTYDNYIDTNNTQEFIINSTNNILLDAINYVKIPQNVNLSFGINTTNIKGDGTNLISSSLGYISFVPGSGQSVKLPTNSALEFGSSSEKITYNGSNLIIDSGFLRINPQTQFFTETSSTSVTNASVIFNGGVSISKSTNASSSSVGGALTIAGGLGVGGRSYFAGLSLFENTDELYSLSSLGGIKAHKKLTVGSNYSSNPSLSDGVFFQILESTFQDNATVSNGTVQNVNFSYLAIPTLSATNLSITTVNSSTFYIEGSPVNGANQTITNSYSLFVKSGISRMDGKVEIKDTSLNNSLVVEGGVTINKNLNVNSKFNVSSNINSNPSQEGVFIAIGASEVTDNVTVGVASDMYFNVIERPTLHSLNTITTTNSSTLVIKGSPIVGTNQTITNNYTLWIKSGISKFDGDISTTGIFNVTNTTQSSSTITGSFIVSGGIGIAKNTYIGGILAVDDTTVSTSVSSGSVVVSGGVGITKQLNIGGRVSLNLENYENNIVSGAGFVCGGNTITNNTGGTLSYISVNEFKRSNLSALATTVTTNSATVWVEGEPIQGINQTLTNSYSLYIASGKSRFNGIFSASGVGTFENNLNVTGDLDVNGETFLDKTNIDTADGNLNISGNNGVTCTVGSNISIQSTSGNISLNSSSTITNTATSSISLSSPTITTSGATVNINPTSQFNLSTSSSNLVVNIGNSTTQVNVGGDLNISGNLLVQGDTTTLNSTIITVEDNALVVNSMPNSISDGGFLVKRYQPPNNTSQGEVVQDAPRETGLFQSHLRLSLSASTVVNYYRGWWIKITSGSGQNYVRRIKSSNATRDIVLYETSDNSSTFMDGLDLVITIVTGDGYNLYPGAYVGMFFNDTLDEWSIGNVPFDAGAGTFPLHGYRDFHIGHLLVEDGITFNGNGIFNGTILIDGNEDYSILLRKLGSTGDVFYVNTNTPAMNISNPVNTVNSNISINLKGYNSSNSEVLYSQIKSSILVNTNGSHTGSLDLNVVRNSVANTYLNFNGDTQTSNFTTQSRVNILNTVDSTSSSGSLKTEGGVLVGKKLYVGSDIYINSSLSGTGNSKFGPSTNNGESSISFYGNTNYSGQTWSLGHYPGGNFEIYNSNTSSNALTILPSGVVNINSNISISGNVTTGTWNGSTISVPYGGTGASTFTSTAVLLGNGTGAIQSASNMTYSSSILTLPRILSTDTTDASSSITGAVQISGGMGVAKALYVGTNLHTVGNLGVGTLISTHDITLNGNSVIGVDTIDATDNGSITICGGGNISDERGASLLLSGNEATLGGSIVLTCGNNNPNGTFKILTGNAERFRVNYDGSIDFVLGTDSSSSISGSVKIAGGVGIAKKLYIGTDLTVIGSTSIGTVVSGSWTGTTISVPYGGTGATSFTSTAVLLGNGTGSIQSGSNITYSSSTLTLPRISSTDTTDSTSYTTGAVVISGGLGIAKDLFSNGDAYFNGNLGIGTFTNVNSAITLVENSNIGINTTNLNDTGRISISGGGVGLVSRGSLISLYGADHLTLPGELVLSSSSLVGSVNITSGGISRISVNTSGITTFKKTTAGIISNLTLKTFTISSVTDDIITTSVAHTYVSGNVVTISGATGVTGGPLNGTFTVVDVLSSTTFTINVSSNVTSYSSNSALVTLTTPATPVTTSSDHGFSSGNSITIIGSVTIPNINNTYTITVISPTVFTIPVNLSSVTTTGGYNSSSGVLFKGAITLEDTQNSTNSTVGGSFTTMGGAAIAQDLHIGGNLYVTGTVPGQVLITVPAISITNETNCGTTSGLNSSLRSVLSIKSFTTVFRTTPSATNLSCTFEFDLPSRIVNLANPYDMIATINGYRADFVAIENCICFGVSGTTRGRVKFTSGNTGVHYIQVSIHYSV